MTQNSFHPLKKKGGGASKRLRDWSLITGRGPGATKREGGAREVLPL